MRPSLIWCLIGTCIVLCLVGCSGKTEADGPQEVANTRRETADKSDTSNVVKKPSKYNEEGLDTTTFVINDSTVSLKVTDFPKPTGRVVNVLVTGVDSRLGDPMAHADANHVMRFFLDSGLVEIISIPRDTYADAGFDDTTGLNKLTNVRANRGRRTYFKAVCQIAGVPSIDYYIEFGFSQAIGLLELLGYKDNASSTLRVLRSRQAYTSGDFQRVYNQGQFMRQALRKNVDRTDGLFGSLALRAALMLVETNMSYDNARGLLDGLKAGGFTGAEDQVWVRLKPAMIAKLKVYEFDTANVSTIDRQMSHKMHRLHLDSVKITQGTYETRLENLITRASRDSAKSPANVIRLLQRPYEQRAWLQVTDKTRRRVYRDRVCTLLAVSYRRTKNLEAAKRVDEYHAVETELNAADTTAATNTNANK